MTLDIPHSRTLDSDALHNHSPCGNTSDRCSDQSEHQNRSEIAKEVFLTNRNDHCSQREEVAEERTRFML